MYACELERLTFATTHHSQQAIRKWKMENGKWKMENGHLGEQWCSTANKKR